MKQTGLFDQGDEFDREKARGARDRGIAKVAANNGEFLVEARACALDILQRQPTIVMDDVRRTCLLSPAHHNAWGAVFKTKDFIWTGRYRQSALVQGHGNMQREWRRV